MKPPEEVKRDIVLQWFGKAHRDIFAAEILIFHGEYISGIVAFLAQQAAEKYIKAFLIQHNVQFPKTHDIELLIKLVSKVDALLADAISEVSILSKYGVEVRYPCDIPNLKESDAKEAVQLAKKVREAILAELPEFGNK